MVFVILTNMVRVFDAADMAIANVIGVDTMDLDTIVVEMVAVDKVIVNEDVVDVVSLCFLSAILAVGDSHRFCLPCLIAPRSAVLKQCRLSERTQ